MIPAASNAFNIESIRIYTHISLHDIRFIWKTKNIKAKTIPFHFYTTFDFVLTFTLNPFSLSLSLTFNIHPLSFQFRLVFFTTYECTTTFMHDFSLLFIRSVCMRVCVCMCGKSSRQQNRIKDN